MHQPLRHLLQLNSRITESVTLVQSELSTYACKPSKTQFLSKNKMQSTCLSLSFSTWQPLYNTQSQTSSYSDRPSPFSITSTMEEPKLKLYSYFRSSCSWRVRIALNLKGLNYQYKPVNLLKGEQFSQEYTKVNPISYVPALVDGDIVVADSLAILLYLEEKYPQHPLLPQDLQKKAINLQAANIVSSSIQPLQNLGVLKYIEEKVSADEKLVWVRHHIGKGFAALEKLLKNCAGKYATGDEVYLADLFLAPQIDAAITRFALDMTQFPILSRLNQAYHELPAFEDARPEKQPDYVKPQ